MHEGEEAGHQGWSQRQVYVVVRDYAGDGFNSEAYLTFSGPGGEASERGQIVDGNLTLDNVWVPNDGNVVITATTSQHEHPTIHGTTGFKADGESVRLNFIQAKNIHSESWSNMEQFTDKVGVKGSAGVDFKIWKAGIEVSGEHSWGESPHPRRAVRRLGADRRARRPRQALDAKPLAPSRCGQCVSRRRLMTCCRSGARRRPVVRGPSRPGRPRRVG